MVTRSNGAAAARAGAPASRLLRALDGFVVISPDGPLGSVVGLEPPSRAGAAQLRIRSGFFVRRVDVVPAAAVLAIVPRRRRVLVDRRLGR